MDDFQGFLGFIAFMVLTALAIFTGGLIVIPLALVGILIYAVSGPWD